MLNIISVLFRTWNYEKKNNLKRWVKYIRDFIVIPSISLYFLIYLSFYSEEVVLGFNRYVWIILLLIAGFAFFSWRINIFSEIEFPITTFVQNGSPEKVKKELCRILDNTNRNLIIVSGSLNQVVWDDEDIVEKLNNLVQKKRQIQILSGTNLKLKKDSKFLEFIINNVDNDCFTYRVTESKCPLSHFVIADMVHIRLERGHPSDMPISERKATIFMNYPNLASRAKMKFDYYSNFAQTITKSNFYRVITLNK